MKSIAMVVNLPSGDQSEFYEATGILFVSKKKNNERKNTLCRGVYRRGTIGNIQNGATLRRRDREETIC